PSPTRRSSDLFRSHGRKSLGARFARLEPEPLVVSTVLLLLLILGSLQECRVSLVEPSLGGFVSVAKFLFQRQCIERLGKSRHNIFFAGCIIIPDCAV